MPVSAQRQLIGSADFSRPPASRSGDLEVRLALDGAEVRAAQRLRYDVFYQEGQATPDVMARKDWRDADRFDDWCDHLIVVDHAAAAREAIVGTYRLIDTGAARRAGGFYSAGEFDLADLLALRRSDGTLPNLLELGRSCVAPAYRTSAAIMLLWRGIASYLKTADVDHMFGCASFPGVDPDAIAVELSYLLRHHRSPVRVRARPERHVEMERLGHHPLDERRAWRGLPPLVRGYVQAGASVGDGAVIDAQFGTVDVFMLIATAAIGDRYRSRFSPDR